MAHLLLLPFYMIAIFAVLLAVDEFIGWLTGNGGK